MEARGNLIGLVDAVDENGKDCMLGLNWQGVVSPLINMQLTHQFAGLAVVSVGLQTAEFIFRGLNRPLKQRNDMEADADKLVYVWRPNANYQWQRQGGVVSFTSDQVIYKEPPDGSVFSVVVTPNKDKYLNRYPEVYGWIEHWTWLPADKKDAGRPEGHKTRYEREIWSSAGQKTKPSRTSSRRKQ